MSEQYRVSGVGITCLRGKLGQELVQIMVDREADERDGGITYLSRQMLMSDAEELFVQALKMIRARQKKVKE